MTLSQSELEVDTNLDPGYSFSFHSVQVSLDLDGVCIKHPAKIK
jgi:hypothetical protein